MRVLRTGIMLYGPPGAGKDTVSSALAAVDARYAMFRRLKAGSGRTTGYRMATGEALDTLQRDGGLLYRNRRYGAEYGIDAAGLSDEFGRGRTVIVHMGQIRGALAVEAYEARWVRVLLWCPREVTQARCRARGDRDVDARLTVWEETRVDLTHNASYLWHVIADTSRTSVSDVCMRIDEVVRGEMFRPIHSIGEVIS